MATDLCCVALALTPIAIDPASVVALPTDAVAFSPIAIDECPFACVPRPIATEPPLAALVILSLLSSLSS